MRIISPSILSANFGRLESEISMLNTSGAEWIHIDVMDGVFVPNISFGFPVLKSVRQNTTKPLDVHLMITEPERYIKRFAEAGADIITFHLEATEQHTEVITAIKECGAKAGISIKPNTPASAIKHLLPQLDLVLVMSVEPGFGGQAFNPVAIEKIREIKAFREECGSNALIEVDGGIGEDNAQMLFDAGADVLVVGTSVFSTEDPAATIDKILEKSL